MDYFNKKTHTQKTADTLFLNYQARQKTRFQATLTSGEVVAIKLSRGVKIKLGDHLANEKGRVVKIAGQVEAVSVVETEDTLTQLRVVYHLGNRHTPVQIETKKIIYLQDLVLDQMITQFLGGHVIHACQIFEPESGAYHQQH